MLGVQDRRRQLVLLTRVGNVIEFIVTVFGITRRLYNYTAFSNTSSAEQWNREHPGKVIYPLENPHNSIHAAVGGFEQVRHNSTHSFTFLGRGYQGVDHYTPHSPLEPFKHHDGCTPLTSNNVANIANLGYTYGGLIPRRGEGHGDRAQFPVFPASPRLKIPNLSRRHISGTSEEEKYELISADAILSRWNMSGCSNCQEHLDFEHYVPLLGWAKEDAQHTHGKQRFTYKLHTWLEPDGFSGELSDLDLETEGC
ncbi:hypothetical protein F5Y14DRAFT_463732 [Nemania sp. NC0429]|nr:hypothetical protein F5Y14DRAFT_463732 [Nemania sp. NC0429]